MQSLASVLDDTARRLHRLVEPIHLVTYFSDEPVARLWHAATLLREHRGDGHIAALVAAGIGGTEAHVLHALTQRAQADDCRRRSGCLPRRRRARRGAGNYAASDALSSSRYPRTEPDDVFPVSWLQPTRRRLQVP
jgi:hypothetical protein